MKCDLCEAELKMYSSKMQLKHAGVSLQPPYLDPAL